MLAARLHKIGDFRLVEIEKPKPSNNELLLKVTSCGICGSDIPRIYQHGSSNGKYPLTIGHEFGGTIVEVGNDADKALIGKSGAVFPIIPCNNCEQCKDHYYAMCDSYGYLGSRNDGGFAEYCLLPNSWNFVEAPNTIDKQAFAMVEPCSVAQHAIRMAGNVEDAGVVIFGAGPIGIMAARWAELLGAKKVMLVDVVDSKVEFAKDKGIYCVNSTTKDILNQWHNFSGNKHADFVIEGTGFGTALGGAIEIAKAHGKIVLMGNPASDTQIKLAQHSLILRKELSITGIWNSYYVGTDVNEWAASVNEIANGNILVMDLVSHIVSLNDLPQLCEDIFNKKVSICKAIYSSDA